MWKLVIAGALTLWMDGIGVAAELKSETVAAFDSYIRTTEARIADQASGKRSFLWTDESAQRRDLVRKGQIVAQPWNSRGEVQVPGGLIHDWIGSVFIPGVSLEAVLAMVRNYDNHYKIYQPEVIASRTLQHDGNHYKIHLRLLKKKIITVVLNSEHDINYYPLSATRLHSRSYSTKIAEVDNPGERDERELPVGAGHGFLWRLYSYWRFEERDGGVYMECQAVSLTRDIPTGFGWLIEPVIRDLPKESLMRTLEGTRQALKK
jgi:hypothetical protein